MFEVFFGAFEVFFSFWPYHIGLIIGLFGFLLGFSVSKAT